MDDESSIYMLTSIVQQRQGVTAISVDPPSHTAKISYEPSVTGARDILNTIRKTGFPGAYLHSKKGHVTSHVDEILQ